MSLAWIVGEGHGWPDGADMKKRNAQKPLKKALSGSARVQKRRDALHKKSPFCHYCGQNLKRHEATIDHKLPQSKGGTNEPHNIVIACVRCNSLKADGDYLQFVDLMSGQRQLR